MYSVQPSEMRFRWILYILVVIIFIYKEMCIMYIDSFFHGFSWILMCIRILAKLFYTNPCVFTNFFSLFNLTFKYHHLRIFILIFRLYTFHSLSILYIYIYILFTIYSYSFHIFQNLWCFSLCLVEN